MLYGTGIDLSVFRVAAYVEGKGMIKRKGADGRFLRCQSARRHFCKALPLFLYKILVRCSLYLLVNMKPMTQMPSFGLYWSFLHLIVVVVREHHRFRWGSAARTPCSWCTNHPAPPSGAVRSRDRRRCTQYNRGYSALDPVDSVLRNGLINRPCCIDYLYISKHTFQLSLDLY